MTTAEYEKKVVDHLKNAARENKIPIINCTEGEPGDIPTTPGEKDFRYLQDTIFQKEDCNCNKGKYGGQPLHNEYFLMIMPYLHPEIRKMKREFISKIYYGPLDHSFEYEIGRLGILRVLLVSDPAFFMDLRLMNQSSMGYPVYKAIATSYPYYCKDKNELFLETLELRYTLADNAELGEMK